MIGLILHGFVIILNQPKQGNSLIHVELVKRTHSQMQIEIDDSNWIISSHETQLNLAARRWSVLLIICHYELWNCNVQLILKHYLQESQR